MSRSRIQLALFALLLSLPAVAAAGLDDPFAVKAMVVPSPSDAGFCSGGIEGRELALTDVLEISLCNNPRTRAAWASARSFAAQLGASQSSLLPALSLRGSANHDATASTPVHTVTNRQSASLSLSYLLFDFGGRRSGIDNARELLAAANASNDATVQSVFLDAAQAYFSLMSARAGMEASRASEASARESLDAAEARYQAGVATPADRLQAKTASSQAVLARVQAEGAYANALGAIANVMGVEPTMKLSFAAPAEARPDTDLEDDVGRLISEAKEQRPDLAAAEARVRAAKANIASTRASGMPQLTLDAVASAGHSAFAGGGSTGTRDGSIALNLNFPVFSGYNTRYRTRAAEAELENSIASRDQLARDIALQVWQAYQNLRTEGQSLRTTEDLLASAGESEALNRGRYREGVGTILDLLSAQSAMANARQQHVSALFNWHAARFALAQAIGALDLTVLQQGLRPEQ